MLTDQIFENRLKVIIGPELFYADNPLRINVANAQQFQRIICPSGMFQFYYLAFANSRKFGDQEAYVKSLMDYGLSLEKTLLELPLDHTKHQFVAELAHAADVTYPTEVIKACAVRGRREYSNGIGRFVEALTIQIQTTAGFDWDIFSQF